MIITFGSQIIGGQDIFVGQSPTTEALTTDAPESEQLRTDDGQDLTMDA